MNQKHFAFSLCLLCLSKSVGQFRRTMITLLACLCTCACLGNPFLYATDAAQAGQKPERVELDTGSGKQVYHLLNGKRYLLLKDDLVNAPRQLPVGIELKIKYASRNSLTVYGRQYDNVRWVIDPQAKLSVRGGDNIWIGGMIEGSASEPVFSIQAWSLMPSDLQIWSDHLKALREDALPEAAFDIAIRLQISLEQALEATADEVEGYRQMIRQACLDGIRRDMKQWKTESVDARIERYTKALQRWKSVAQVAPSDLVEWLSGQYESLLKKRSEWSAEQFKTEAALAIGSFVEKFQPDIDKRTEELKSWYTEVGTTLNNHQAVQDVMQQLGYEYANGSWIKAGSLSSEQTSGQQNSATENQTTTAINSQSSQMRLQTAQKQMQRQQRLLEGKDSLKTELVFDEILREQDNEELELQICNQENPEDACRYALQAAQTVLSENELLRFYTAALQSPHEGVRRDAIERLALMNSHPAVDTLAGFLTRTNDPLLRRETMVALRGLPKADSVQALIWLAGSVGLPAPVKAMALTTLKQATGQDFGDDMNAWQSWLKNSNLKEVSKSQ